MEKVSHHLEHFSEMTRNEPNHLTPSDIPGQSQINESMDATLNYKRAQHFLQYYVSYNYNITYYVSRNLVENAVPRLKYELNYPGKTTNSKQNVSEAPKE